MPESGEAQRSEGCTAIAELLPVYLNRSLDEEARRRVESHLVTCPTCQQEERDTRTAWALYDGHLPVEELLDYAFGSQMPSRRREMIERHLTVCERCADELSTISREPADEVAPVPESQRADRTDDRKVRALTMAASLAALIAGSGWVWTWQQLERELLSPPGARANISVSELLPANQPILLRSDGDPPSEANRVLPPDEDGELVLILLSGGRSCASSCAIELYGAEKGEPRQRVEGLVATEDGHITLALPASWLRTEDSTILVVRHQISGEMVAEYLVESPAQATTREPFD